jgi:hypothetical protein
MFCDILESIIIFFNFLFATNQQNIEMGKNIDKNLVSVNVEMVDRTKRRPNLEVRMGELKKIFQSREILSKLKINYLKKKRIIGRPVFDFDRDNLIKKNGLIGIGEVVAYQDEESDKLIYAMVNNFEDYQPKGRKKFIRIYSLIVDFVDDETVFKKNVFPEKICKFSKP